MFDEKRQTRLLPFRRRRAGGHGRCAEAGEGPAEDFPADPELTELLRAWEAPAPSAAARGRLLADFRATVAPRPLWRRALAAELRVPLPVAACAAAALLLSSLALGGRVWTQAAPVAADAARPGDAPAAAVRVVEVPVVQERVVTRVVYVDKKERGAQRGVSSVGGARASAPAPEVADAARPGPQAQAKEAAADPDAHAGYFTRVDMNDFQPTDNVKLRIVQRGGVDEK
ncbi:MAG TPA: hypothetical protein VF736_11570 [Pyrinomonadaceae bacterium]